MLWRILLQNFLTSVHFFTQQAVICLELSPISLDPKMPEHISDKLSSSYFCSKAGKTLNFTVVC